MAKKKKTTKKSAKRVKKRTTKPTPQKPISNPVLIGVLIVIAVLGISLYNAAQDTDVEEPLPLAEPTPAPTPATPPPVPVAPTPNPKILELFERSDDVKSVSFGPVKLPEQSPTMRYEVKGNHVKIELVRPLPFNGWGGDFVFLDLAERTANAYCVDLSQCKEQRRKASVRFDKYAIPLPQDWQERLIYGEIIGSQLFDRRKVHIVHWQEGAIYYEAYVDGFYGYVVHVAYAEDPDFENLIGGYDYKDMAFNAVDTAEPPY